MEIKEFRKQVKQLGANYGLAKNDISITSDSWLRIRIKCTDTDIFYKLKSEIEKLAEFKDESDPMTDYFHYKLAIENSRGYGYSGMLITKAAV